MGERGNWVPCEGWWEQVFHGRQPMEGLHLAIDGRVVDGLGTDIIGPFTLHGLITEDGRVSIRKDYLERHSVRYEGQHDGEGRMWGVWALPGFNGRWMIALRRAAADSIDAIGQIAPVGGAERPGVRNRRDFPLRVPALSLLHPQGNRANLPPPLMVG